MNESQFVKQKFPITQKSKAILPQDIVYYK